MLTVGSTSLLKVFSYRKIKILLLLEIMLDVTKLDLETTIVNVRASELKGYFLEVKAGRLPEVESLRPA